MKDQAPSLSKEIPRGMEQNAFVAILLRTEPIKGPALPRGNQIEATLFVDVVSVDNGEF
jgi:hypothetical protein